MGVCMYVFRGRVADFLGIVRVFSDVDYFLKYPFDSWTFEVEGMKFCLKAFTYL